MFWHREEFPESILEVTTDLIRVGYPRVDKKLEDIPDPWIKNNKIK